MPQAQQLILRAEHSGHIQRDIGRFLLTHSYSKPAKTWLYFALTNKKV